MLGFFFIFFFIFFLIFWFYLLKYSGVKILTISIPSFLLIAIFIFQYLGYPILFFSLDDYRAQFIIDKNIILRMFFITSYTITLIITGFILAKKTFGPLHSIDQYTYHQNTVVHDKQLSRLMLYLLFILSSIVLLIYISKVGFKNVALLSALNLFENSEPTKVLRANMGNAFDGKYHWYRLFMRDFLNIVSVALFGFYLFRKKLFYLFIFIISFFIGCFSMTMATEKGPIMWYLVSLLLMYILLRENGRFKVKHIIGIGVFGLLLLGFIYVSFMNSQDVLMGMKNALSRITTGQMQPLYHYLEIFPKDIDFVGGRSFPNPGGLVPYEPFILPKEVFAHIFPEQLNSGIVGSMPTFFWGEMYANFGYVGVILPPFFIGYFLFGLNIFLFRLPKTPILLSFYIWISLHYFWLSGKSLTNFIVDTNMFVVFLFLIIIISAPSNLKLKYLKFSNSKKKYL